MNKQSIYLLGSGAIALSISYYLKKAGLDPILVTDRFNSDHIQIQVHTNSNVYSFSLKVQRKSSWQKHHQEILIVATKRFQNDKNLTILNAFNTKKIFFCQNGLELNKSTYNQIVWHGSSVLKKNNQLFIHHFDCFYYNSNISDDIKQIFSKIGGIELSESQFIAEQLCKFAVACTSAKLFTTKKTIGHAIKEEKVCIDCTNIINEVITIYSRIIQNIDKDRLIYAKKRCLKLFEFSNNALFINKLTSSYTSLHLDLKHSDFTEIPWLNAKVVYNAQQAGYEAKHCNSVLRDLLLLMSQKQKKEYTATIIKLYGRRNVCTILFR